MDSSSNLGFVPAKAGALLKTERKVADLRKSTTCMSSASQRRRQFDYAEAATGPAGPAPRLNGIARSPSFSYGDVPQEKPALGNVTNSAVYQWLDKTNAKVGSSSSSTSNGWEAAAAAQSLAKPANNHRAASVDMAPGAWKTELAAPVGAKPLYKPSMRAMPKSFARLAPVDAQVSSEKPKKYNTKAKSASASMGDQLVESIKSIGRSEPLASAKASSAAKPPASKKAAAAVAEAPKKKTKSDGSAKAPVSKAKVQKPKPGTGFGKRKPPTQSMSFANMTPAMAGVGAPMQIPYGSTFEVAAYTTTSNTQTAMYSTESPETGVAWDGLGNEESKVGVTRSPIEALFRAAFRMD